MKIHEYQGKDILRKFNVPVPKGEVAFSVDDAVNAAKRLGGSVWVVKAQIHAGGRGKGGGVKVAKSLEEVKQYAKQILGFPRDRVIGMGGCLDSARYGISWGAIGVALDCYDVALRYSKERIQFGKPIGAFQLQQKKLAEMITEITKAQLLTFRLGQLRNEGRATSAQISMAKRNNIAMAKTIISDARQILGAMGITGEYPVMRHMMNLESVITYEGTHDIHLLITGMDVTGFDAFK